MLNNNVEPHLKLMDKFLQNDIYYNIFWMFYKTSAWFYAPDEIRIIEVLSTIELKKMIEIAAVVVMGDEDEEKFMKLIKVVEENYLYTMAEKLRNTLPKNPFVGKYEYNRISYLKHVELLSSDIVETYKKLNFIQHNSLVPSSQTNMIKNEILETALKVNEIIVERFISIAKLSDKDGLIFLGSHNEVIKNLL